MSQGFHMLTSGNIVMPSDIWVPVTKRLPLMHSDQVAAGAGYEFVKGLTLEVEGYYKWMHNLAEYRDGASFLTTTGDWQNMAVTGRGRAYGAEVLLKKETGKTTGWLSYTWAKALRTFDRPMQELNGGREFPAANDRRHNLNYKIPCSGVISRPAASTSCRSFFITSAGIHLRSTLTVRTRLRLRTMSIGA